MKLQKLLKTRLELIHVCKFKNYQPSICCLLCSALWRRCGKYGAKGTHSFTMSSGLLLPKPLHLECWLKLQTVSDPCQQKSQKAESYPLSSSSAALRGDSSLLSGTALHPPPLLTLLTASDEPNTQIQPQPPRPPTRFSIFCRVEKVCSLLNLLSNL